MRCVILALSFLAWFSVPVSATVVTYELAGSVTHTDAVLPAYMPGIDVNDPISLFITFDDSVAYQDPLVIGFNTSKYELFVGDFRIYGENWFAPNLELLRWQTLPVIHVDGPFALVPTFPGDFLHLWDGQLTFSGLDLVACLPGQCDDTPGFVGTITTATRVPDSTSTALLLAIGIGVVLRARRVKQA